MFHQNCICLSKSDKPTKTSTAMLKVRSLRFILFIFFASLSTTYIFYLSRSREDLPSNLPKSERTVNPQNQLLDDQQISAFLNYSAVISIGPFLIEPFLLYNRLNSLEQTYFLSKNLNPHVFRWTHNFYTFGLKVPSGLTKEERTDFLDKLCQPDQLNENDLDCVELNGDDNSREWQFNDLIEATRDRIRVGYLFTHQLNYRIHLVLFYFRSGSLWTGQINNTETVDELTNFKFGLYEELFDDFDLASPIRNVQMPADPLAFLMEKNNSRLIECDRALATDYYNRYNDKKESRFIHKSLASIAQFKRMMISNRIPFFMSSGTLLGWYRQCNIISFTNDVDFMADSRFASTELAASLMANQFGFAFLFIFGQVNNGYEFALASAGYKVDLFFIYPADNNQVTISIHTRSAYSRYSYPKFDLCTGQLRGVRLNVPCNVRQMLSTEYGEDWARPVREWDFVYSPSNKGPTEYWPRGALRFRQFNWNNVRFLIQKAMEVLIEQF